MVGRDSLRKSLEEVRSFLRYINPFHISIVIIHIPEIGGLILPL